MQDGKTALLYLAENNADADTLAPLLQSKANPDAADQVRHAALSLCTVEPC